MHSPDLIYPEFSPDQAERSRQAARRFEHVAAAASSLRSHGSAPLARFRHRLATRLVATARLIDAT